MIRVIYRWRVAPENFEAFQNCWIETTNRIHESVPGARGSFMLRGQGAEDDVLTVARWDSRTAWQTFWGNRDPEQMEGMRALGEPMSVQVYDEIGDFTR